MRRLQVDDRRRRVTDPACGLRIRQKISHELVQYTVDHPHLRHFDVTIWNNGGTVHPPPVHSGSPTVAMPSGDFTTGSFFFRGGARGTGGVAVNIGGDAPCAYSVTLSWLTRHWLGSTQSMPVLYCK